MNIKLQHKLSVRLTLLLTTTLVLVIGISIIINFINEKTVLYEQIQEHGKSIANAAAISIIEPLLTDDIPAVETYIEQLTRNKSNVKSISIWRADNTLLAHIDNTDGLQQTHRYLSDITLDNESDVIGRVEVMLSSVKAEQLIQQRLVTSSLIWLLMSFFLALLLFLLLKKIIIQPLSELTSQANQLRDGLWDQPIFIPGNNEFSYLANTLDEMRIGLAKYKDLNEQQKQELSVSNETLHNALADAQQAVKSKTEFLASMSHEIRTPMNGVLGMLGLLSNTSLDNEQHYHVNIAKDSAQILLVLINDILDFSKMDADKLNLEMLDFDLRRMLGEFAEAMGYQAQDKGLELILDMKGIEQSTVKGDPSRLRQILNNIVSNAIKFTSEGEIVIRCDLASIDDAQWQFNCNISDTGIGVPDDKQSHLFDSFTQADGSTTRKYGGTGLGLAIVKKLCDLMGGGISFTSEPGKGSCFEVSVRLYKNAHSQHVVPQVNIQHLNLLIVDDNATNRQVLREQLEYWGASVVEAENGTKALDICEKLVQQADKAFFDMAFLDMQMPDMDGAELGKYIKSDQRFNTMKLVMMVSMVNPDYVRQFTELGVSGHFLKPATTSDLFDALTLVAEDLGTPHQVDSTTKHQRSSLTFAEEGTSKSNQTWRSNPRILLVEDNQMNQVVAKGILGQMSLQADVADNGLDALLSLQQAPANAPYTLILMDCQMPKMDGYEASRKIRAGNAGERNKSIPIIAMTANVMAGDREKCINAGMNDYLPKPIDRNQLNEKLHLWLSSKEEP